MHLLFVFVVTSGISESDLLYGFCWWWILSGNLVHDTPFLPARDRWAWHMSCDLLLAQFLAIDVLLYDARLFMGIFLKNVKVSQDSIVWLQRCLSWQLKKLPAGLKSRWCTVLRTRC